MTVSNQPGTAARPPKKARKPATLGPLQVLGHTGLSAWQLAAAVREQLVPDAGPPWPVDVADGIRDRRDEIVAVLGEDPPIGGHRAAHRLAARTELAVEKWDVGALAAAGHLAIDSYYDEWPIYDCRALDAVPVDVLAAIVGDRVAWFDASVHVADAAGYLGWRRDEFRRVAAERDLTPDDYNRIGKAELDALAGDEDLAEQLRVDRLLTTQQATEKLELRSTDFKYLIAADLLAPKTYTSVQVSRYREVDVPLYRVGDLEELRSHPAIDWEALHSVKPGDPSPLRELSNRPVDRAAAIRRWIARLGQKHEIETWAWWHPGAGRWEIDFERTGALTVDDVRAAIAADETMSQYEDDIAVSTHAGAALRWARVMREPGAAVILDTETTDLDGYVVEIAVVDAATGQTLLDSRVNPRCPISPGARWIHGISDDDVADAPDWSEVLPQLLAVTAGRTVLAYNAGFDHGVVVGHSDRDGLDPAHLADFANWACLMGRRSDWQLRRRWLPLNGSHSALGDCQSAYELLQAMTSPSR
ncbi:3'-5' exonuclease [Kribbella sancticallisti]|uniref:3'-5' exonuclease n=1 Tax=Kribbella sancticallisti TaxID=460087 RepID=UPI0031DA5D3B